MKGEQEKIERIIRIKDRRSILTHFVFAMNATKPGKGMVITRFDRFFRFHKCPRYHHLVMLATLLKSLSEMKQIGC